MTNFSRAGPAKQSSSASGQGLPPTGSSVSSASGPEPATQSQSYQEKLAGRANSGAANALAAAAAAGGQSISETFVSDSWLSPGVTGMCYAGTDRDMQAAAPSGRHVSNDTEVVYDVAVRLPGESQTQLEARKLTPKCERYLLSNTSSTPSMCTCR